MGEVDECREAAERATAADPLFWWCQAAGAWVALADGDLRRNLVRMRAAAEMASDVPVLKVFLAFAQLYAGQGDDAARTLSQVAQSGAGMLADMGRVFGAMIRMDRAREKERSFQGQASVLSEQTQ